ncbi:HEAT repeat domain-containing protein [Singulisphaera sp. PoT]|uniref:HEAT repeat domain-containing protein n=1 Tax=Singulisphaera sp. PoT TaxID=3411797 RepID=UPI003BF4FB7E
MKRWIGAGLLIALGAGSTTSWAQVVERQRDVTITGPRGRTIERSITTERGPGFVERQVNITRPGGSMHSDVFAHRAGPRPMGPPPGFRPGPAFGPGPAWRGWGPRPAVVEVNNGISPGAAILGGAGLFGLGMVAGSAMSAPAPAPVYAVPAQPPVVVVNQPQPYSATPPPPPTVVVDLVNDEVKRLQSYHSSTRRDACNNLGRMRDPRAIPALLERLKYDNYTDVRVAAANALGEIGDPQVAVYLERATVYDKKQAVRDAAAASLSRLPREVPVQARAAGSSRAAPIESTPPPPEPANEPGFRN